ncbi:hypothetical protein [uncultured Thiohalocapsa sp.]|uniref:hypothetical protein n=1 Tax=uncultured Thiohalocapsa sp. TaxID=768990 RepID=UPI0025D7A76D|nr:hypothetical protein [uncultured Thiohalocapsa sp.]
MKHTAIAIALAALLIPGLASLDAVAGKGGGGGMGGSQAGGGAAGSGRPAGRGGGSADGMMGGGMHDGAGAMGRTQGAAKRNYGDIQPRERVRTGEKDDMGVRVREGDYAQ